MGHLWHLAEVSLSITAGLERLDQKSAYRLCASLFAVLPVWSTETLEVSYLCTFCPEERNPKGFVPVYFLCEAKKP